MKKRDYFWLIKILSFLIIILLFSGISLYNILQFNNSYMQEEENELNIFKRQIEFAIEPYLQNKDIKGLQTYCNKFKNEDVKFRIFDKNKKYIVGSKDGKEPIIELKNVIQQNQNKKWKIYRYSIRQKMVGTVSELEINNATYYLETTISEENMIKTFIKAQENITVLFVLCMFFVFFSIFQVFYKFRKSFDKLENSVIKIANGDLNTKIEIPHVNILEELTLSIKKMTQQLKNKIEKLKQLEEYKDEFIQNVSHEIKTPITAINMALELLESKNDKEFSHNDECFSIIQFQIKAINKLVNDILCLSEIDAEKLCKEKQFTQFNLNELAQKLVYSFVCNNQEINLISDKNIEINGNENLINTMLSNLLTNAIKYSNSEKIDVVLSQNKDKMTLQVKDYGVGIKPEHLDKIFDKFYRVDKARSRKNGGTGLGLAIVKNIAELHNGTISVESEENKGTCFTVILPV